MTTALYSSVEIPPYQWRLVKQKEDLKTVGVVAPHYGSARVSYGMAAQLASKGYRFTSLRRWPFHILNREHSLLSNTAILTNPSVDLVHTMNILPINGDRFVTSFELEMPRYLERKEGWEHRMGWRIMRSERCRRLMSLSEIGSALLKQKCQKLGMPEVAEKVTVFRGAIEPSVATEEREYRTQGPLKLMFVGAQAFRKGIVSAIAAIEQLRAEGAEVELTVVSSLQPDGYVTGEACPNPEEFRQALEALPWASYYKTMPNQRVRQLMRTHDLLLIPSFDETLGWVVVEAGMEGLGVVATDVFAFSELIDQDKTGRMLFLPKQSQNRWRGLPVDYPDPSPQLWVEDSAALTDQLVSILRDCIEDRTIVRRWGEAAREKMMGLYHPAIATQKLASIYAEALDS